MSNSINIEGFVVFVNFEKGSKSEHYAPVLISSQGKTLYLEKKGDNPFMHESFKPLHLKFCKISGEMSGDGKSLSVDEIDVLPDPVYNFWKENDHDDNDDLESK